MKKKFLVMVTAVIMAFMCVVGLVACGDDGDIDGTYYSYVNGEKRGLDYLVFKDGKVDSMVYSDGHWRAEYSGTYTVEGVTVKCIMKSNEKEDKKEKTGELTIVSDGVLKLGPGAYLCKDGYTPPADE